MPSSTPFTGAVLQLLSVQPLNRGSTLLVTYTLDPRQSDPAGANDALNTNNYVLTGPTLVPLAGATTVGADPLSIHLTLATPLTSGSWTLTVANVETPGGDTLQTPVSVTFSFNSVAAAALNSGSENDDAESIIRKHLSPGLAQYESGWSSLIAALSVGDNLVFENARLAYDQLFKSTASGVYLDRHASDEGITRPSAVGFSDEVFRRLSIKTTARKVVTQSLLDILEVYYGTASTRARPSVCSAMLWAQSGQR